MRRLRLRDLVSSLASLPVGIAAMVADKKGLGAGLRQPACLLAPLEPTQHQPS